MQRGGGNFSFFFPAPPAAGLWQWFSDPPGPSTSVSQCRVELALFQVGLATKRSLFARGPCHLSLGSRHEQLAPPAVGGGGGALRLFPPKAGSRRTQCKLHPTPKARKKIARLAHVTPHSFGGRGGAIFSISSALDALHPE